MSERRLGWAPAAIVLLFAAGCGGPRLAPADAAARVDGRAVPYAEFEEYVASRVGIESATSSLVLSGLLDQFLDELLLRTLAVDEDLVETEAPGWQVVEELLASREPPPISELEIGAYYRDHAAAFARPERVVLNQALAEDSQVAGRVADALAGGESFEELVGSFDAGVSLSQSEIAREDLPVAFADRIFELEPGEVSEVIAADYGFHVFQVVARRPAELASLDEARPRILDQLALRVRRRALEEVVGQARGRYNVEVFARNLPFNYEGQYDSPNS